MIFHISLAADDPQHTAEFLATLWGGRAYPFPPVVTGSWIAMAGDERNSAIEVYPRGTQLHHGGATAADVQSSIETPLRDHPHHSAIASPLDANRVLALAEEAGFPARLCNRGPFRVIEVWIDGSTMFEVLPPDMQQEYLGAMTIAGWEGYLASVAA